jgi:hypothetical protein
MSNFFSFVTGTIFGVYVAQTYKIPNIKNSTNILLKYLESLEKNNNSDKDEK